MNYEQVKNLIEFNRDYTRINNLYNKYNSIRYIKNIIIFMKNDEKNMRNNIDYITTMVKGVGYNISYCENYDNLNNQLDLVLDLINQDVKRLLKEKDVNKIVEEEIKRLFNI